MQLVYYITLANFSSKQVRVYIDACVFCQLHGFISILCKNAGMIIFVIMIFENTLNTKCMYTEIFHLFLLTFSFI